VAIPPFLRNHYAGIADVSADGIFVAGGDGAVEVRALQPVAINVYSLSGAKVASQFVSGEARIELPAGVYVVNGVKIAVR
jgi:hypothetical protein